MLDFTSTPSSPRWRRRAEERPQELLEAALDTFVERGYAATSMDEIARRAGVSKGTLYLYYPGKAELLKAVVRQSLLGNLAEAQTLASEHGGSCRELLVFFLGEFTRRVSRTKVSGIPKLILAESGNFPEIAQFYFDEVVQRAKNLIKDTLRRGIASGEFRPVDPDYAWRMIVAPLVLGVLWKHTFQPFEPDELDFDRYLECQLDLLTHGLIARDAPAQAEAKTETAEREMP